MNRLSDVLQALRQRRNLNEFDRAWMRRKQLVGGRGPFAVRKQQNFVGGARAFGGKAFRSLVGRPHVACRSGGVLNEKRPLIEKQRRRRMDWCFRLVVKGPQGTLSVPKNGWHVR